MDKAPWQRYRVGKPSNRDDRFNSECRTFSGVSHVAHVQTALSIIRDAIIKPQLVFDQSKLNTRRILVNWVSPNFWTPGFRYGNVSFDFDWNPLIEARNFYWVEAMTEYNPTACRILVTSKDYSNDDMLIAYEPRERDGPWWYDEEEQQHYYNGDYCLEFMLESELLPRLATDITFVKHHPKYCCLDPASCLDLDRASTEASALFIAGVIANRLTGSDLPIIKNKNGPISHRDSIYSGLSYLLDELRDKPAGTAIRTGDPAGIPVARAMLSSFFYEDKIATDELISLFSTSNHMMECVESLIKTAFNVTTLRESKKHLWEDD